MLPDSFLGWPLSPSQGWDRSLRPVRLLPLWRAQVSGLRQEGCLGALVDMGVPGHEAKYYEEAVHSGGTLVIVRAEGEKAEDAQSILDRHGALGCMRMLPPRRPKAGTLTIRIPMLRTLETRVVSSQWSHTALTASERKSKARVYPDKRKT